MHIFIMRHGEAENINVEDSLRPLTKHGAIEAEKMGHWLARRKLSKIKVFVSPYLRAQQSCAHAIAAIKTVTKLNDTIPETLNFITPSGNAQQVHDFIDGFLQKKNIVNTDNSTEQLNLLFVSHMPFVSYLVGALTNSTNMPIFSTGSIAVIDYNIEQMKGQLIEQVSPESVDI
jgi:phosphohistidine phosphatase